MKIFSYANRGPRVQMVFPGKGRAKQSMKDECDINVIMAKYLKTGQISHGQTMTGDFADADSVSFHEAMNIVTEAEQAFMTLPAKARQRFANDPAGLVDLCQDPERREELVELGLLDPLEEPEAPAAAAEPPAPAAPAADLAEPPVG